jgi:hypothetical protein
VEKDSLIYVAGHRGLVGSAICRNLRKNGFERLLLRSRAELDLTDAVAVQRFFQQERPAHVFLAAAKVGGILANDIYPADFIRENLIIQTNVIEASYRAGVDRLLFLGSSCIYPKLSPQPIKEEYLLTGPLEPTNSALAIWPPCPPISTVRVTTSILRIRMSYRRSSEKWRRQKHWDKSKLSFGERAPRAASFSTAKTWPKLASF